MVPRPARKTFGVHSDADKLAASSEALSRYRQPSLPRSIPRDWDAWRSPASRLLPRNQRLPDNPARWDQIVPRIVPASATDGSSDWPDHKAVGARCSELADCATAARAPDSSASSAQADPPASAEPRLPGHGPLTPVGPPLAPFL